MKGKNGLFTHGMINGGVEGDPLSEGIRQGPKTKSFGYQVLGFGSGGGPATYNVQYLVIAGGAAGNNYYGAAGGGAGGMRLIASKLFEVTKCESYPIQVGDGGPSSPAPMGKANPLYLPTMEERKGQPSIFSTITSTGGGTGGSYDMGLGFDGGSGGGGGAGTGLPVPDNRGQEGTGNLPAIPSPLGGPQGNPGGKGHQQAGGGGGGHGQVGQTSDQPVASPTNGRGGNGTATDISGACTTYAGGGGHGAYGLAVGVAGGTGGGGAGAGPGTGQGQGGQVNTGGGAGGSGGAAPGGFPGQPGGSGIVIIRRLTADSCSTSGTDSTCGSDTIHKFTGDGTFVA